jgi:C4-dicarboxylate-specific signal transduction histidine kinase
MSNKRRPSDARVAELTEECQRARAIADAPVGGSVDSIVLGAEEALRQSELRTRALLRAMPDLMFLQSGDGVYLDYHARGVGDLLVPPSQFLGRSMHDVLPPALAKRFADAFARARESDEEAVMEYSLPLGGEERTYEARIIASEDGTFLSVVRDVTERKTSAEALRVAQTEVARATRMVTMGELAASIAHEVSQPLTAIIANGRAAQHWLASGNLDEVREVLKDIIDDGNRAAAVMSRSRALVQRGRAGPQSLGVAEVVTELLPLLQQELEGAGVALRTELAVGLPLVRGDRIQLGQVVLSLIMNAVEAMRPVTDRPRMLEIRVCCADTPGVIVTLSDTGVGIDPQHRERLFDPFFTTKPDALGMGLTVSRSIVELYGGRLRLSPQEGPGATFTFTLPAADPTAAP